MKTLTLNIAEIIADFNNVETGERITVIGTEGDVMNVARCIWQNWYPKSPMPEELYLLPSECGHFGDDFIITDELKTI